MDNNFYSFLNYVYLTKLRKDIIRKLNEFHKIGENTNEINLQSTERYDVVSVSIKGPRHGCQFEEFIFS